MTRLATIVAAALAVFVLIVVSASGADLSTGTVDRCLVCHPRAHVDDWSASHANELAVDPQQGSACTRCHTTSFCSDCHAKSVTGAAASIPTSGQELVATVCVGCHSLATVQNARKDRAGWTSTIQRMVRHGLSVDATRQQAIIEYLSGQ